MYYKTHNEEIFSTSGTYLVGTVQTTYWDLVHALGEPIEGDGYKVDWMWEAEFEDGTIATVYNWKNGPNYLGDEGKGKDEIYLWHVGGKDGEAETLIQEVLDYEHEWCGGEE